MKILMSVILVAACSQPLFGCDLCAIYSASQARGEVGQGAFAGVAEQFTHFATVQADGREVANPSGQSLDSSIAQLFGGYNFSKRIGLQFNLPVIYRDYRRPDGAGGIDRGSVSGIGDASLLATVIPYRRQSEKFAFTWSLLAGIKFPTGSSDRIREEFNEVENPNGQPSGIHGHDLTLGTGSFDGIIGSGVFLRSRKSFLSASVQYAIRSEGDFDYQFANDLTWAGGPGYYVLLKDSYSLAVQAVVSGEYKGKDRFGSETAEDTGMTAVYLGPQLNFTFGENLSAYLAVDLPMSIENSALQIVPDYRVRGGITWHF